MRNNMLSSFLYVAASILIGVGTLRAQQAVGPYLHADAGVSIVEDLSLSLEGAPVKARLDPGFRFSLGPGYTLFSSASYETAVQFETGFAYNALKWVDFGGGPASVNGELWQVPFLVDIVYRFGLGSRLQGQISVGGGGLYHSAQLDSVMDIPVESNSTGTDPAVQGMAGLYYRLSARSQLGLGYKYLAFFPGGVDFAGVHFDLDHVSTHSVFLTYTLRF